MDVFRLYITKQHSLGVEVSWIVGALILIAILLWLFLYLLNRERPLEPVKLSINLGHIGSVSLCPTWDDVQIAHRIWTELITRKAAIPVDLENDLIVEVYDSWYALFQRVRQLIGDIPGKSVRNCSSTKQLVRIATDTLNAGLRPHLTRWQAEFRVWWDNNKTGPRPERPQDLQKLFPHYAELVTDLQAVNEQLVQYANELQKLVYGDKKR